MAEPAELHRTRGVRAQARRDPVGVAVDDLDVVHRHTEQVADDHRERGVVALAVRARAGGDGDERRLVRGGGRPQRDGAELHPRSRSGRLDVERQAEPELLTIATVPARLLLARNAW